MRRFPAPLTALLRERVVCGALLLAGVILVAANALGIKIWHCAFLEVTGKPCPGCGLTRGMTALCHGDLAGAMKWHPFTPMFALGGVLMVLAFGLSPSPRQRLISAVETVEARTGISLWLLLALVVFGVWRMIK